jgi:hypothetical protein
MAASPQEARIYIAKQKQALEKHFYRPFGLYGKLATMAHGPESREQNLHAGAR